MTTQKPNSVKQNEPSKDDDNLTETQKFISKIELRRTLNTNDL